MSYNWEQYSETLPRAYEIYRQLFGEPSTHKEWAERFNKIGLINRILQDEKERIYTPATAAERNKA